LKNLMLNALLLAASLALVALAAAGASRGIFGWP